MKHSNTDWFKFAIDTVTGTSAASWPLWFQYIQTGVGLFMLAGGAILLVFRLAIAYKEWKRLK